MLVMAQQHHRERSAAMMWIKTFSHLPSEPSGATGRTKRPPPP
jgi:hypothetical protein